MYGIHRINKSENAGSVKMITDQDLLPKSSKHLFVKTAVVLPGNPKEQ